MGASKTLTPEQRKLRAKIANRTMQARCAQSPESMVRMFREVGELKRELRASRAEDWLRRIVDEAPPFTDEQRERLRAILAPAAARVAEKEAA